MSDPLLHLQQQLIHFGLNPHDWKIELIDQCGALVHLQMCSSRDGAGPQLEGWAKGGDWLRLEWIET